MRNILVASNLYIQGNEINECIIQNCYIPNGLFFAGNTMQEVFKIKNPGYSVKIGYMFPQSEVDHYGNKVLGKILDDESVIKNNTFNTDWVYIDYCNLYNIEPESMRQLRELEKEGIVKFGAHNQKYRFSKTIHLPVKQEYQGRVKELNEILVHYIQKLTADQSFAVEFESRPEEVIATFNSNQEITEEQFGTLHHELGHEWFGNKMSVGDWADMWIHEGFTAFGDWLFYEEHGGSEAYFNQAASVIQSIPHAKPVVSPPNSTEEEAYHGEIYSKGAAVVHGLRGVLGDEVFFPMLKAFNNDERFTYQNQVTTQDFIDFVNAYTSQDLSEFLNYYLKTTEIPEVNIKKKGKSGYLVSLKGIDFKIPVEIQTSNGLEKISLGSKPIFIPSMSEVKVDPKGWLMLNHK